MSIKTFLSRSTRLKWRGLKTIDKNIEGVAAVEFALILPLLALLYLGGIELSLLMQADRRVTTVTATIGDLASRHTTLNNNDVSDIFDAARIIISPLDPALAQMRLSSLVADNNGQVTVEWSDGCNTTPRADGSSVGDLPQGIVPAGGSIILAEVMYEYDSLVNFLTDGENGRAISDVTLNDRFYLRPRRTEIIQRDDTVGQRPCSQ